MKVKWIRGNHRISFNRPDVWFGIGQRGTGKSSFLEHVGCNYIEESNAVICDLFGSRD
jgi:predicted ATPase